MSLALEGQSAEAAIPCQGKPRPVLIIQDDRLDATVSITVCPLTTAPISAPLILIPVAANVQTGLSEESALMVDKVTTV